MKYLNLINKNNSLCPGTLDKIYAKEVSKRIHKKYSIDAELAILRQRDTKPEEFAEYNAYVENCKIEVKSELGIN